MTRRLRDLLPVLAVAAAFLLAWKLLVVIGGYPTFVLPPPVTVEVDFALTIHADMAELCPGATRTGGRTVAFTHQDYREVFRGWRAMLNLSAVV